MGELVDLTGQAFGNLYVLHIVRIDGEPRPLWQVRCSCGREYPIRGQKLRAGPGYCGTCARRKQPDYHGQSKSPTYLSWRNMHSYKRLHNVKIIAEWDLFVAFKASMGERPEGCWLKRRDSKQPYGPSNCYWHIPASRK